MIDPATAVGIATAAYEIIDTVGTLSATAFGNGAMTVEIFNLTEDVTLTLEYQSKEENLGVEGMYTGDTITAGKGPPPNTIPPGNKEQKAKAGVFQTVKTPGTSGGNYNFVVYKAVKKGFKPVYLRIAWGVPLMGAGAFYFVRWQREWTEEVHNDSVVSGRGYIWKNGAWVETSVVDAGWFYQTAKAFVEAEDPKNNSLRGVQRDTLRLISKTATAVEQSYPALRVVGTFGVAPLKIFVHDAWVKQGESGYEDKDVPLSYARNGPPK